MSICIEVPDEIYEILNKVAKKFGRELIDYVIEKIINDLDLHDRIEIYEKLHEKYLREGNEFYKKGDLIQAGEKYWGALTALLNIIGEIKKLPHYSHRDYAEIIEIIYEELKDDEIPRLFASAERLHANYYHGFLKELTFKLHREDTLKLIQKLKNYLKTFKI